MLGVVMSWDYVVVSMELFYFGMTHTYKVMI